MADNDQQLPANMNVAPAATPQVPGTPAGSHIVSMPNPTPAPQFNPYQQPPNTVPANQVPPAPPANTNPMLTTLAPPQAPTAQPEVPSQPALPTPPVVPAPPAANAPQGPVADLAGALGTDPMIAPAISYLEAACTSAKLDVARAFGQAADELDARFIDRAYLVEKVGPEQADQLIKVAESSIVYAATARENLYTECKQVAGGQAGWDQAVTLFNQHADPQTKAAISAMFDSLNRDQMLYASQQLIAFAQKTGGLVQSTPQPLGNPSAGAGMSADEYRVALAALPRNASDEQYKALYNQRAAGKKQGR